MALAAAMTLLASGCGGPSPEERFAERACSTTLLRAQEMLEIFDDVTHIRATPGGDAFPSLLGPIHRGKLVATKLVQEVRALPVPDTAAGKSAAIHFEDEVRAVFDRLAAEERRVRGLSESPTLPQTNRALNDLEIAFVQAVSGLKTIDYGVTTYVPELQQSFESAESCKELDALGED